MSASRSPPASARPGRRDRGRRGSLRGLARERSRAAATACARGTPARRGSARTRSTEGNERSDGAMPEVSARLELQDPAAVTGLAPPRYSPRRHVPCQLQRGAETACSPARTPEGGSRDSRGLQARARCASRDPRRAAPGSLPEGGPRLPGAHPAPFLPCQDLHEGHGQERRPAPDVVERQRRDREVAARGSLLVDVPPSSGTCRRSRGEARPVRPDPPTRRDGSRHSSIRFARRSRAGVRRSTARARTREHSLRDPRRERARRCRPRRWPRRPPLSSSVEQAAAPAGARFARSRRPGAS